MSFITYCFPNDTGLAKLSPQPAKLSGHWHRHTPETIGGIAAIFQKQLTLLTFKLFKMATANSNLKLLFFGNFSTFSNLILQHFFYGNVCSYTNTFP